MNRALERNAMSLEARVAASPWRRLTSLAIVVAIAAVAAFVGKMVAEGPLEVGLLSAAALAGLAALRYLGLPTWCSLLLITTVAARGPRAALGLPPVIDFIHYPITLGFALAATYRPPRAASRSPGRWLAGLLGVVVLSAIAHPGNPLRALLFLIIVGEPLAVIWAIARWGTDQQTLRTVGIVAVLLAAINIIIGVYQGLTLGWQDPVQGTLTGHGAGQHILGALFALGLFVMVAATLARRLNPVVAALGSAGCLGMMLATGAMSVVIVAAFATFVEPFFRASSGMERIRRRRSFAILASLFLAVSALVLSTVFVPGILERADRLASSGHVLDPEITMIRDRVRSDPLAVLLGSGPGTSASRASLLLGLGPGEGTPLEFLGLEPTDLGRTLAAAVILNFAHTQGGSAEDVASGVLGVVGDLGLVGLVAWGVLMFAIWRQLEKSRSWLAPAARSALLMAAALSFVDNWFEYPEFAVPLAILIGFVASDVRDGTDQ